jgi:ribosomal protein L37AE/L43A
MKEQAVVRELRTSRAKGNTVKKQIHLSSNTDAIICPCCGIDELERGADGAPRCTGCDRPISTQMLKTLEQIASLPDAIGSHACECGHPEMRHLADGVLWCPGCGSEVVPLSASAMRSESGLTSEAYRCGWAEGLFGNTESFVRNDGLARWEDAHDRLAYYRGHRAGRAVRF